MAETYSLAVTGIRADNELVTIEQVTLPDSVARPGNLLGVASSGAPFLCKNPDGSFQLYTLDPERSTPTVPVLRPFA